MVSFRQDPYLWIHLAGLAAVPLCLDLCLAGLATGGQQLPVGWGIAVLTGLGVLPIVWMQWQRPFYIFSLGVLTLYPADLSDAQRRLLVVFRSWPVRYLTGLGAVGIVGLLWWLYPLAPLAVMASPLGGLPWIVGFAIATLAFLACNLFIQVPLSVIVVLLTQAAQLEQLTPYPLGNVTRDFTLLGLRTHRLLPAVAISAPLTVSEPVTGIVSPQSLARTAPESTEVQAESSVYEDQDLTDPWV